MIARQRGRVLLPVLDRSSLAVRLHAANTLLRLSGQPAMSVSRYRAQERAVRR